MTGKWLKIMLVDDDTDDIVAESEPFRMNRRAGSDGTFGRIYNHMREMQYDVWPRVRYWLKS